VQLVPLQPPAHWQVYVDPPSMQAPPFWHGLEAHGPTTTGVWHVAPVKSGGHWHVKPFNPSLHEPPLRHGFEAQSSMSTLQLAPV
jgi:hypothetical protein